MVCEGQKEEDSKIERWKQSTKALLSDVRSEKCRPYSIPVVPNDLQKWDESAYIPKVVSIGPRYKGRRELLQSEEIKWRCVTTLLSRTFGLDSIEIFMEEVLRLDETVRASYVGEITLDRYDLARTMIFDGCFLLELLICESEYDSELPIPYNAVSPGIKVKKMDYVISDLMLLDNQIPIFILELLFEKLLGHSDEMRELIQNLALPLLGFPVTVKLKPTTFHFLDIAYSFMEMGWIGKKESENVIESKLRDRDRDRDQDQYKNLYRCATRLKAVGITIQLLNNVDDGINFRSSTEFDGKERILKIPKLIITETTEASWRSFIAWEHHKKNGCLSDVGMLSICTSSALLFRDLICCSSDVQLLKDKKIIVDRSGKNNPSEKNNRDLVAFFHSMAMGVDRRIIDLNHAFMFKDLNKFRPANYATKIFIVLCHYFCKILDLCYNVHKFLKRGYNFAATIVSFLTVVQTFYSVLAYHYPKKG